MQEMPGTNHSAEDSIKELRRGSQHSGGHGQSQFMLVNDTMPETTAEVRMLLSKVVSTHRTGTHP